VESYQQELAKIKTILKNNPKGMTVTDIAHEININRNSVAKYLDVLLISGHAEMVSFGPAKVFFPSSRIPLSAMLNLTHDYIVLLDRDLRFIQVSENLLKFLGMPRDTIIGHSIETFAHSIFQLPEMSTNARRALEGKETVVEQHYPPDTKELSISIKHIPTTFDDGEPGVTLLIEDITERKRTEEKMKQAAREWELTFNSITDMISIQDDEFFIQRANQAYTEFLHMKPEEIIGKKCYELLHGTHTSHQTCPCIQIQQTKKPASVEFYEPHLGKYIEITASPLMDENGNVTGSVHIIKDITDRKKKEG
jgi:PAS domain S-box-containing protein